MATRKTTQQLLAQRLKAAGLDLTKLQITLEIGYGDKRITITYPSSKTAPGPRQKVAKRRRLKAPNP